MKNGSMKAIMDMRSQYTQKRIVISADLKEIIIRQMLW